MNPDLVCLLNTVFGSVRIKQAVPIRFRRTDTGTSQDLALSNNASGFGSFTGIWIQIFETLTCPDLDLQMFENPDLNNPDPGLRPI